MGSSNMNKSINKPEPSFNEQVVNKEKEIILLNVKKIIYLKKDNCSESIKEKTQKK